MDTATTSLAVNNACPKVNTAEGESMDKKVQDLEPIDKELEAATAIATAPAPSTLVTNGLSQSAEESLSAKNNEVNENIQDEGQTSEEANHEVQTSTEVTIKINGNKAEFKKVLDEVGAENQEKLGRQEKVEQTVLSPLAHSVGPSIVHHQECMDNLQKQRVEYEQQIQQMQTALAQKENMITLYQRENAILDKEKSTFRREMESALKDKEATVIKFAMKEKLLLDAKKAKEAVEKQLAEAKKEIKNVSLRFQAVNEDKSRMTYMMDEKCNEVRKYQRECEKLKTDYGHLESKLKYHVNKLNLEMEAKAALEKKLEEERNSPNKLEEKANEKLKMEFEANTILLKHEIEGKLEQISSLSKENAQLQESVKRLNEELEVEKTQKMQLAHDYEIMQAEHTSVQNSYSEEILNSAKLRGQLEELQVLRTQNTLNQEKIAELSKTITDLQHNIEDNADDLKNLHLRENELLSINKEMSEKIVNLQSEVCMLNSKLQGLQADNEFLKKEKQEYDGRYAALEQKLREEVEQKANERLLLTKHISEKTKAYELNKTTLDNLMGEHEAAKHKHATIVKELQREIHKYKKQLEQSSSTPADKPLMALCRKCLNPVQHSSSIDEDAIRDSHDPPASIRAIPSLPSSGSNLSLHSSPENVNPRRPSASSEASNDTNTMVEGAAAQQDQQQQPQQYENIKLSPSKKHLVERILRLQQASARQAEKIDFLENHTLSLVAELQKKSKVVQYYMMRDQAGALTSPKSDQNKTDLAKYGNGVMAAIYNGIKGENKSMSLELSLEINRKLQAVLEDTLLKNITLKENLDVLGLEVDNLTRKLRQMESKE